MWTTIACAKRAIRRMPRLLAGTRFLSAEQAQSTRKNLMIGKHTRVIYQGFTGRVASSNARESIEYGTNVVGGVTPGKDGEHLGLPLLPSVKAAVEQLKPDATAIFVPGTGAAKAIEEAIEAEIPLIVAVAEHIPVHDMMRITDMLATSKSRLVGANSPGIISPLHSCRIGFQPLPMYKPGRIGVVAKSGTLSYEAVASLSRAGLGQSLCIGAGGDIICGTHLLDGYCVLRDDPDTEGIVVVGELGGKIELDLASQLKKDIQDGTSKPAVALVAGRYAPGGRIMGHAGAFNDIRREEGAQQKHESMQKAGFTMVDHPEQFGSVMKALLAARVSSSPQGETSTAHPSPAPGSVRSLHTAARPALARSKRRVDRRSVMLSHRPSAELLREHIKDLPVLETSPTANVVSKLNLSINRRNMVPEINYRIQKTSIRKGEPRDTSVCTLPLLDRSAQALNGIDTDSTRILAKNLVKEMCSWHRENTQPITRTDEDEEKLCEIMAGLLRDLVRVQRAKDIVNINLEVIWPISEPQTHGDSPSSPSPPPSPQTAAFSLAYPRIHVDDSAFKTAGRQEDLFRPADGGSPEVKAADAIEAEAAKTGIVYVRLHPRHATAPIGTLVNGAGLAMNTVDALALPPYRGKCANFLDTGGKATSETVRKSFELILSDPRVKVIFVNIFGGLTDCAMIADGILLAFAEVDMRGVPVVVRLRGTNEAEGQRKIAESGLSLEAFDGFADAAARVVELVRDRQALAEDAVQVRKVPTRMARQK